MELNYLVQCKDANGKDGLDRNLETAGLQDIKKKGKVLFT